MVLSILTSRVVLYIRAQAGDNPFWSDGTTELDTIRLRDIDSDTDSLKSQNHSADNEQYPPS